MRPFKISNPKGSRYELMLLTGSGAPSAIMLGLNIFGQALIEGSIGSAATFCGLVPIVAKMLDATSAEDKATESILFIFNLLPIIL